MAPTRGLPMITPMERIVVTARLRPGSFSFEGVHVERSVAKLVNDPVHSAAFAAGAPLLEDGPQVAHEAYHWQSKEDTMKRILIAADGSPSALEALEYGLELASEHDAAVTFAYVVPGVDVYPTGGFGLTGSVPHELTPADSEPLDEALRLAEEADVSARTALLRGEPADEIVAYADSIDADMIVVGSRGHGRLASALLGSVSRAILREARRPVLVIRGSRARAEVAA